MTNGPDPATSAGVGVQFYHLTTTRLDRALPKLLEKAVAGGYRVLLLTASEEQAEQLNQLLWTYDTGGFLPHGTMASGQPEKQPILISTGFDAPNQANLLAVTNGAMPPEPERFERILDIFDGSDAEAVIHARTRWKQYKDRGHAITYLRQTEAGGWDKKEQ